MEILTDFILIGCILDQREDETGTKCRLTTPAIICVPIHVTGVQNRKAAAQRKMETLNSMMNGFLNKNSVPLGRWNIERTLQRYDLIFPFKSNNSQYNSHHFADTNTTNLKIKENLYI